MCSQTTQEGIDLFLSQRLDSSWEQDKRVLPQQTTLADGEGTRAFEAALNQEELARESGLGVVSTGWQGREAELALEVRTGCCGRSRATGGAVAEACLPALRAPHTTNEWAAGGVGGQQMRRLVQGCYGARETAERISQVELVGGRQGQQAGHPHHRVRLVYRLLDRLLNSQPDLANAAAQHGGAGAGSVQEVAQRLDGALGFLQDAYWDWLRLEWLPAIQVATTPRVSSRPRSLSW